MSKVDLNFERAKEKIGVRFDLGAHEVERGMIAKFVKAVGDSNPLWNDDEYARKSRYGGIIAPPILIVALGHEQFGDKAMSAISDLGTRLNGGMHSEWFQPVRPGDVISVTSEITDISKREGKKGELIVTTFDIAFHNQRQELVARCRRTAICVPGGANYG